MPVSINLPAPKKGVSWVAVCTYIQICRLPMLSINIYYSFQGNTMINEQLPLISFMVIVSSHTTIGTFHWYTNLNRQWYKQVNEVGVSGA